MAGLSPAVDQLPGLVNGARLMSESQTLAQQLLRFDTINPPGNEAACMHFLADWLAERGFDVTLSTFGENRLNLMASLPGRQPDRSWDLPAIWIRFRSAMPTGSTTRSVKSSGINCMGAVRVI